MEETIWRNRYRPWAAEMAAIEVIERRGEFLRIIGPVFGRLEADYTGPLIERCFLIRSRSRMFAALSVSLKGQGVDFEYASPQIRAQKQIEAAGLRKTIEELGAIAQLNPAVRENFDADQIARDTAEAKGLPFLACWCPKTTSCVNARHGRNRSRRWAVFQRGQVTKEPLFLLLRLGVETLPTQTRRRSSKGRRRKRVCDSSPILRRG
ncbi:MAG: portal protein [Alphaproteobacteria bacterium]|nr:portal protein [Alphaproteobacteria bacterium]